MQISLDYKTIPELIAIIASGLLGIMVLANHWRDRPGRLFGLLCLSLSIWKSFDFAYPGLTTTFWVDAAGWSAGIFSVALAFHFIVAYAFDGRDEPPLLFAAGYPLAAFFILTSALGYVTDSTAWQVAYGIAFIIGVGGVVGLMAWAYLKERSRELIWALLGSVLLAIGVALQLIAIMLGYKEFYSQTYGMLAFEICFGYDILLGGFLRERQKHMYALKELGLREQKLEAAEAAFQRLVDTSYDIIFTIDREARVTAINSEVEEVLGYKVEQFLGYGYLEYLSTEDQAKIAEALLRGFEGEKIRFLEVYLNLPDKPPAILSLSATRLSGEDGEAALMIARDVTEERKMEHELQDRNLLLEDANVRLRELNTLKTELVGIMGHELRSPLTIIYSYAAALKDHWNIMEDERKLECVEHMLHECNRLNRMVENVLDMSRVESERLFLHIQKGDMVALLENVTREMSLATGARPIRLITPMQQLEMEADWDKVKQVIINLLDNAFRFSLPGTQVIITGDTQDGKVVVRVKDMGPGIPPENRDRLFDKFTQSQSSGMERGLGLGLYLVRTFVEAHGGEVWLEDEEELGAIVAFSLPLQDGV
jgi:PAS domain S-box-containing protein